MLKFDHILAVLHISGSVQLPPVFVAPLMRAPLILLFLFFGSVTASSQTSLKTVEGIVTDRSGDPVEGVSVGIKGIPAATLTDTSGRFSLLIRDTINTLVFSSVGYMPVEYLLKDEYTVHIVLEALAADLGNVVVVGYGTRKKTHLTGAVSVVAPAIIEDRPVSNVLAALQGAAPGLIITRENGQPGREGWLANIRGFSSLNGANAPLVVVDGAEADLQSLNPGDILSISVLKDAAAGAIYGARSSGGVIIITTKKGMAGRIKIEYSGMHSFKKAYNIPERLHSWEEAEMVNVALENVLGIPNLIPQQMLDWMKDPDTNYIADPANPAIIGYYYDLNQVPLVMRDITTARNHAVSVSGGDAKTSYLFSMGYYGADGVFRFGPDGTNRYNARLNLSTQFNRIFSLDARLSYTQSRTDASSAGINGDYGLLYNIYQLRTLNPIFLPGYENEKYAFTSGGATTYPILKEGGYDRLTERTVSGVFTLKAGNLVKGLTLRTVYSPRLLDAGQNHFVRTIPLWGFDQTGEPVIVSHINPVNSATKLRSTQIAHDIQALADYEFRMGAAQDIQLLGGFQYQHYDYDFVLAQTRALISNDLPSLNLGGNPDVPPLVADNIQRNAWISYFGRFNYDLKDRYLLEFSLRFDQSSRLAPGHRGQLFPSLSAGWILNKEPWWPPAFIDALKLRLSWGRLGNAQLGELYRNNYNYIAQLVNGPVYPFNDVINHSLFQQSLPSPGLGWEIVETMNGGADIGLLNNRLQFSFDYFRRENRNMLISQNVPALLGLEPGTTNAASMRTVGWEAVLGWKQKRGDLSYYVGMNIGDNRNKITRYAGQVVYQEGLNVAIPGLPINSVLGYIAEGYFNTATEVQEHAFQDNRTGPGDLRYRDLNNDGRINGGVQNAVDHGDLIYLGNTSPRYNFGINLNLAWKGFDCAVFFQGTGKRSMMIYPAAVVPFADSWRQPTAVNKDYWTAENTDARFPRLYAGGTHNTRVSSHWVQNAAYLRFKNLQVGYTLPVGYTSKLGIERIRIFATGEDIWETSKMWLKYFNPENPNNASFNYPFFRSYAAGINVLF